MAQSPRTLNANRSVVKGFSLCSILTAASASCGVEVTDRTRQGWASAIDLITHLDWCLDEVGIDGDAALDYLMISWLDCGGLPPDWDGELVAAAKTMGEYFRYSKVSFDDRRHIAVHIGDWMEAAGAAKTAVSIDDYIQARQREGHELAKVGLAMVSPYSQNPRYRKLIRQLAIAGCLIDTVIDYRRDVSEGTLALRGMKNHIMIAIAATQAGWGALRLAPRLTLRLAIKTILIFLNRYGRLNAHRRFV